MKEIYEEKKSRIGRFDKKILFKHSKFVQKFYLYEWHLFMYYDKNCLHDGDDVNVEDDKSLLMLLIMNMMQALFICT